MTQQSPLKRTVKFFEENFPEKNIVCITHTNKAVEEIAERVGSGYEISTIHSFLNALISPYNKNLLTVLPELFCIPKFERFNLEVYKGNEKKQKTEEHKRYKESYEKLARMRFTVLSEDTDKVIGKVAYDKDPETSNIILNKQIDELNVRICTSLAQHHHKDARYNETPFDSFKDATFGHDGLIKITSLLFSKYKNLGRILRDKYDCIFIDEYQDTNEDIIRSFIYQTPTESSITLGLFGDSEQAIYEGGIGSARDIIDDGKLLLIEKEDNFRCSPQVIEVSNKFRTDGLKQEVALKEFENNVDREGTAKLFYALRPEKPVKPKSPSNKSSNDEKKKYQVALDAYRVEEGKYKAEITRRIDTLVSKAQNELGDHILLKLPNKSVARDASFGGLYSLFDARYSDTREKIKNHLDRLQFGQLCEILKLFESSTGDKKSFNRLILLLKKQGFLIQTRNDKKTMHDALQSLLNSNKSAYDVMQDAIKSKIISVSEGHEAYLHRKDRELQRIAKEPNLEAFKTLKEAGCNTILQMQKHVDNFEAPNISKDVIAEEFDERVRDIKIENFYIGLFGEELKFEEILSFYRYENDDSNFMTMHKTKGTGIENVLVVLDEFNWTKYDFSSCFDDENANPTRQALTRKLLYVACSRAKKNLICIRITDVDEVKKMKLYFDDCNEIKM
ncbi:UvrD-helicase domain-containing protein [Vibrio splendidus]|uniref:UvrD-helicase domain-containing protein n=1 Tax=Vibrio splendidus TaxID=29497 RepID=UPI0009C0F08D|nr:UvrD-helicase domain-containing protein [Vibrio splendidus]